jgi:hypothetical protein
VEESGFWSVSTIRSLRRAAESVIHSDPTRKDDNCSRAYLGYVMAFTCRLQGGAAPMGPNPLDAPPAITALASLGAVGPLVVSAQPLGPRLPATADAAAARLLDHTAASGCARVGALSHTAISRRHGK